MVALAVVILILAMVAGAVAGYLYTSKKAAELESEYEKKRAALLQEARELQDKVRLEAEKIASSTRIEEMHKLEERTKSLEEELHEFELSLERESQRIALERKEVEEQQRQIDARKATLKQKYAQLQELRQRRKELLAQRPQILEERAGVSRRDLMEQMKNRLIEQARISAAQVLKDTEEISEVEYTPMAKRIMGIAIGRIAPVPFMDRIPGPIHLTPKQFEQLQAIAGQDLAGVRELIGKEFSIQEKPDDDEVLLRIEGVDTVGREVTRRLLEKLPPDVRTMEQLRALWEKKLSDMDNELVGHGRKAFKHVGLKAKADVEILKLLGRLYYRTSYYQNQWLHSIEAAQLIGLMVHEIGLDARIAKRAALLHDIGKALTHEKEGSHALIGAEMAEKYGEDPIIVNAIAAHHGDVPAETYYARLVMAADALSGARPGARKEISDVYIERIKDLERLARNFPGVTEVYAVQAGREVRVIVDEQHVTEEEAYSLASRIAERISSEMVFPGEIKVTVIRTLYAEEVAR